MSRNVSSTSLSIAVLSTLLAAACTNGGGVDAAPDAAVARANPPVRGSPIAPTSSWSPTDRTSGDSLAAQVDVKFEKTKLANGLTLIVHEDHKAPIVAVDVWYHVGSKNEKPGKTGFAHLYEHLMFCGTENLHRKIIETFEAVGATGLNGTTNVDRTNYFENVPKNALDHALWVESDRMGHLLGAIDQGKLDEQRGVVQNEKRQGENRPYGQTEQVVSAATVPVGHPYSWTTIGSMDDLNAASLEDVKEWFRAYYGAANATLVVAGDVDPAEVKAKVEKYFGDVPSGPPITRPKEWVVPMVGTKRATMDERVAQPRLTVVWNVPRWGDPALESIGLFGDALAGGKTSRLYQRLVVKEALATDCFARIDRRELGGQFQVSVSAKPGVDLANVEAIVDEEIAKLAADGPSADELDRVRTPRLAGFVRGLERIGGFGGKADLLAEGEAFGGDPAAYRKRIAAIESATASSVKDAAQTWIVKSGRFVLSALPYPKYTTANVHADRSAPPDAGTPADALFPKIERTKLSNGLDVLFVTRHAVPTVDLRLMVEGGSAADPAALSGLANLTLDLMDEGTTTKNAVEIGETQERLGARLSTGASNDQCTVSLSALKSNLAASLDLMADVVLHPSFPQADFERIRKDTLVRLEQSRFEPNAMANRVLPLLLYGKGHPYGRLGGGAGTEASLAATTTDQLADFHERWFKPNHAKLLVVGDTTLAELQPLLEQRFGAWKRGDVPSIALGPAQKVGKPVVYLLDKPQAVQSVILAAIAAPPTNDPHDVAITAMNDFLGGAFTSRINLNLREDKHWSYGAHSRIGDAKGPRAFVATAPVQTDKTRESMVELQKELTEVVSSRPGTPAELEQAKAQETLTLAGRWETNAAVLGSLAELVQYSLPDDHWTTYAATVRALTLDDVNAAAKLVVEPTRAVWIVVGDRAKIEAAVRAAGVGDVVVIDPDGRPLEPQS